MSDVQTHMHVQDAIETAILDRGVEPPADLADIVFAAARAALEAAPSSLRAELAEARAEIARLTEERDANAALRFRLASAFGFITEPSDDDLVRMANRYRDGSDDGEDQLAAQSGIIEAATALVKHRRGPNHWNGTIENDLINKLIDAVTAVEEGGRTDE